MPAERSGENKHNKGGEQRREKRRQTERRKRNTRRKENLAICHHLKSKILQLWKYDLIAPLATRLLLLQSLVAASFPLFNKPSKEKKRNQAPNNNQHLKRGARELLNTFCWLGEREWKRLLFCLFLDLGWLSHVPHRRNISKSKKSKSSSFCWKSDGDLVVDCFGCWLLVEKSKEKQSLQNISVPIAENQ